MLRSTTKRLMKIRSARYVILYVLFAALLSLLYSCGGGGGATYSITRNTTSPIGAPSSIIAYSGNGSITITWSVVSGVNSYRIYRSLSSPVTIVTGSLIASGLVTTSFLDTNVTNSTPYYYVMTSIMGATESAESAQVSAIPGSTGSIQGTIRYEDKEYDQDGFTGNTSWKSVRYAAIDLVSNATKSVLDSKQTDSMGNYSFATTPSTTQVYIRVNSMAAPSSGIIRVKDLDNFMYAVPSDPLPLSGSAFVNISIPVTNMGGAFNILDVMTTGYEFFKSNESVYPAVDLASFWAPGNGSGTYYCMGGGCSKGDGIYVLSQTGGDTDEFDDDVLWHEFGHFLASIYSVDQSQGGYHSLSDIDHDLRFSWSEGWGDFLPGAVKTWLAANDPARLSSSAGLSKTLYVDTPSFAFDFGSASMPAQYSYASGEVAVAKVLHRLRSAFSMQDVWDIFMSFPAAVLPTKPANLELFWDQWLLTKSTSTGGITVQSIFEERQILYRDDAYEQDDSLVTAATITVGMLQSNRTLFLDGDSDYVRFTPQALTNYKIQTSSLRNGTDTYLELYNNLGALMSQNDNDNPPYTCNINLEICHENGSDVLSSTITFGTSAITPTGPYTIRVVSSPLKPASAGRYGTYNLLVTTQ